ncbi:MAG: peroxiredoxin family protein [Myxococcaceae bacterium]
MLLPLVTLLLATTPKAGDLAPDFTVKDTDANTRTLSEMVKRGPVIIAFFPKAFTGGCMRELTAYRERYADVANRNAQILAVSTDNVETLQKFKAELKAPFAFVSDELGALVRAYDVKTPVISMAQRYTFVVGQDRKVLSVTSGSDAVDPSGALNACPLRAKTGDAGTVH